MALLGKVLKENKMLKILTLLAIVSTVLMLTGCGMLVGQTVREPGGMGKRVDSGLVARHQAPLPAEYAGLTNPIAPTAESLTRGEAIYAVQCAVCHGDGGMGDAPAGVALDPPPGALAHTSQVVGDNYLFWRTSEGGDQFQSTMPAYKTVLSETERWDVINYIRALGSGAVTPQQRAGGQAYRPELVVAQRAEALAQAVAQNVLTKSQAETFETVHKAMDELQASGTLERSGGMADMQARMLDALVSRGTISQTQADTFRMIHPNLLELGWIP